MFSLGHCDFSFIYLFIYFCNWLCFFWLVFFFSRYKLKRPNQSHGSQQLESHLSALTFRFVTLFHPQKMSISNLRSCRYYCCRFLSPLIYFFFFILKNENVLQHSVFLELKSITTFSDIKDHTFNQIISFKLPPMTSPAFPQYLLITV